MDENSAWKAFESSGKVTDYLAYNNIVQKRHNSNEGVDSSNTLMGSLNANQNSGSYNKTT